MKKITVNGKGTDALDFTYVEDLADGVVKVLENENPVIPHAAHT
jgi:nucleoside-diphosphate-sugar epimerase